jgi:hypothetical protein
MRFASPGIAGVLAGRHRRGQRVGLMEREGRWRLWRNRRFRAASQRIPRRLQAAARRRIPRRLQAATRWRILAGADGARRKCPRRRRGAMRRSPGTRAASSRVAVSHPVADSTLSEPKRNRPFPCPGRAGCPVGRHAAPLAVRSRTPPWKGVTRARTEPVSWLEAEPPTFPGPIGPVALGRSTPAPQKKPGLSQWRGRAGLAPDFRKGPVRGHQRAGTVSSLGEDRNLSGPVFTFTLWRLLP